MNSWLLAILLILTISFIFRCTISLLNIKALKQPLPYEFSTVFTPDDYTKSQNYTKDSTITSLLAFTVQTIGLLTFIVLGGFNIVDLFARSLGFGSILTGIIFIMIISSLSYLLSLPFSLYSTFVLEERYGFNKTTGSTFLLDQLKAAMIITILGIPLLALILWFFDTTGNLAWLYCWLGVVLFSVFFQFIAPVLIFPIFNTYTPLQDGELKDRILEYAQQERFQMQGIFTMDGSKRSTKLNAFFAGFGRFRKIVFYDTLLEKLENAEIVAVLAHEMGHFKLNHIPKRIAASIAHTGLMFYLLSWTINNPRLFEAFSMNYESVYASIVFFGIIFSPVNFFVSTLFNFISRCQEFKADLYCVKTTGKPDSFIAGLKKLSHANLTNLTPHKIVVFFHFTHPPVIERIRAITRQKQSN